MYYLLALLLARAIVVECRNDTIIHGWVAEPDGRGTWSVVWSCLATIFICIWSALHLDVPERHGFWFSSCRKVRYMLVAVLAPEFFLVTAFENYFTARVLLKDLVQYGSSEWTLTHTQFVCVEGFYIHGPQQQKEERCTPQVLQSLAKSGRLTAPSISEEELRSRGKTDEIVKLIAVLQITWFALQILFRAIQHLNITPLETMTIAYIFCSLFTYGLCWSVPQGIEYPISVEVRIAQSVKERIGAQSSSNSPLISWIGRNRYEAIEGWTFAILLIFGPVFGAVHCLAWNLPFPTPGERLAWRICSVTTASLPIVLALLFIYITKDEEQFKSDTMNCVELLEAFGILLYAIGRITIIVLAFTALRALPADTYQTLDWNNYLPHFAA